MARTAKPSQPEPRKPARLRRGKNSKQTKRKLKALWPGSEWITKTMLDAIIKSVLGVPFLVLILSPKAVAPVQLPPPTVMEQVSIWYQNAGEAELVKHLRQLKALHEAMPTPTKIMIERHENLFGESSSADQLAFVQEMIEVKQAQIRALINAPSVTAFTDAYGDHPIRK